LWLGVAMAAATYGLFGGVAPAVVAQVFPVELRYLGVAVVLAANAVIGAVLLPIPALAVVGPYGARRRP
jgi:hypothetical protein